MKAFVNYSTRRAKSDPHYASQPVHSCTSVEVDVIEKPMWWHDHGRTWTASGYGARIPTRYMVRVNGRLRRVYCRIYSSVGTLYIGKLSPVGERAIVVMP